MPSKGISTKVFGRTAFVPHQHITAPRPAWHEDPRRVWKYRMLNMNFYERFEFPNGIVVRRAEWSYTLHRDGEQLVLTNLIGHEQNRERRVEKIIDWIFAQQTLGLAEGESNMNQVPAIELSSDALAALRILRDFMKPVSSFAPEIVEELRAHQLVRRPTGDDNLLISAAGLGYLREHPGEPEVTTDAPAAHELSSSTTQSDDVVLSDYSSGVLVESVEKGVLPYDAVQPRARAKLVAMALLQRDFAGNLVPTDRGRELVKKRFANAAPVTGAPDEEPTPPSKPKLDAPKPVESRESAPVQNDDVPAPTPVEPDEQPAPSMAMVAQIERDVPAATVMQAVGRVVESGETESGASSGTDRMKADVLDYVMEISPTVRAIYEGVVAVTGGVGKLKSLG